MSRHSRLPIVTLLAVAAFQAGALTQGQQSIEVVRAVGPGGTISIGGGSTPLAPISQTGTGMLVGQVVDAATGSPVLGALVAIGGAMAGMVRGGAGGPVMIAMDAGARAGGAAADADPVPRVLTDSNGRFAFRNLPAGSFNLVAEKAGYLEGAYGRLRPGGASQQVEMADGGRRDGVTVRLFRPAVITGRLVDERGEPVVGAQVRVYPRELRSGRRVLGAEGRSVVTDDRGVYRISGLTPGEYVVAAPTVVQTAPASLPMQGNISPDLMATMMTPGNNSISLSSGGSPIGNGQFVLQGGGRSLADVAPDIDGRLLTFPTTYHPTVRVASQSVPIALQSGEERSGVDLMMSLVPTTTISGRLMGPDGPAASYALHLVPSGTGEFSADPSIATAITAEDGSFMFAGVPAGNYVIQTVRVPRGMPRIGANVVMFEADRGGAVGVATREVEAVAGRGGGGRMEAVGEEQREPTLWTSMPIAVDATPVAGVALNLREGYTVSGRIEFQGAADRPTPDQMTRIVVVAEPVDGQRMRAMPDGRVTADGRFETAGMLPGRYVLRAMNAGRAWTLHSVTLGGVDVSDTPLDVQRDSQGVVVIFTDQPSNLRGVVRDGQGQTDEAAAVLVFPADSRHWVDYGVNPRRMRLARTGDDGDYAFSGLPAGDYFLLAIPEEYSGEWQDPRFLEQAAITASRFTVTDGGQHTQDLTTQPFRGVAGGHAPLAAATEAAPAAASWTPPYDEPLDEGHGPFVPDGAAAASTGAPTTPRPAWSAPPAPVARAGQQARDSRVVPTTGMATVSGRVLHDDGSGQPVRRARVSLRSAETRLDHAVMTDDQGRFVLSGVPAGRYSLTASKPAYITTYYGSRRAGRGPGVPVAVTEGARLENMELRMPRGAVISGRAFDDMGQPMANVGIRVMRSRAVGGARALMGVGGLRSSTQTDDRGSYRIYGLEPGEYVVVVNPPRAGSSGIRQLSTSDVDAAIADLGREGAGRVPFGGRAVGFAPVYYPGTTSGEAATRVTVAAGQELEGIDIPVSLVPTATIEGTIVGPDGRPVPGVSALLLPESATPVLSIGATSIIRTNEDGTFAARNVVPGRYKLSARWNGGRGATQIMEFGGGDVFVARSAVRTRSEAPVDATEDPGKPLWAEAVVDVSGQDLSGLVLTMQEGMTVRGRVTFDGTRPVPEDLSSIRLSLQQASNTGISLGVPGSAVNEDGTFALEGVIPGTYRLSANVPSGGFSIESGWLLQSALAGGRDVLDSNLEVLPGRNVDDLVVSFTDRRAELSGTVVDPNGAPVSDLTILVFPTNPAFWSPMSRRMPQPQQPGSDGQFRFSPLPPGEYYLAAVTEIEDADWGDPGFMEQVAAAGLRLTIADGEQKVQDLQIGGG